MNPLDLAFGFLLLAAAAGGEIAVIVAAQRNDLAWESRYILGFAAMLASAGFAGGAGSLLWSDSATGVIVGALSGLTLLPVLARTPPPE